MDWNDFENDILRQIEQIESKFGWLAEGIEISYETAIDWAAHYNVDVQLREEVFREFGEFHGLSMKPNNAIPYGTARVIPCDILGPLRKVLEREGCETSTGKV